MLIRVTAHLAPDQEEVLQLIPPRSHLLADGGSDSSYQVQYCSLCTNTHLYRNDYTTQLVQDSETNSVEQNQIC